MALVSLANLFSDFLTSVLKTAPSLVGAFLLLLIGWILGRIAERLVLELLKRFRTDNYFKIGKNVRISEIISLLTSWIIYLVFISAAVDYLRILTLTLFFSNIVSFLSRLLSGTVILLVGYTVASYVQKQVEEIKTGYSEVLGQVIFFFSLIITISMAFQVVGIPTDLLNGIILLLVGGIALGMAIALGLGLKDSVGKLAKKHLE